MRRVWAERHGYLEDLASHVLLAKRYVVMKFAFIMYRYVISVLHRTVHQIEKTNTSFKTCGQTERQKERLDNNGKGLRNGESHGQSKHAGMESDFCRLAMFTDTVIKRVIWNGCFERVCKSGYRRGKCGQESWSSLIGSFLQNHPVYRWGSLIELLQITPGSHPQSEADWQTKGKK